MHDELGLRKLDILEHTSRVIPLHLLIPDRDNAGPGTLLLEKNFYRYHECLKND